jgi:ubiquinone biosynthesis monooxygenase Coq7
MSLWGNGGFVLGFLTALTGRKGVWICTAAVEATVHRHLEEQLDFLRGKDAELLELISAIQQQELMHLKHAEQRIGLNATWGRTLSAVIASMTEVVIWLSTWGGSTRLRRSLTRT